MYKKQLSDLIIATLTQIDSDCSEIKVYSEDAVNLLLGTAAQESDFGEYIRQLGGGPARGIFQIEPETFNYLLNYIKSKGILERVKSICNCQNLISDSLEYNLKLSIIFCRLRYYVINEALPTDLTGYARYWKKYYNTYLGAGTEEQFINNYKKYVL